MANTFSRLVGQEKKKLYKNTKKWNFHKHQKTQARELQQRSLFEHKFGCPNYRAITGPRGPFPYPLRAGAPVSKLCALQVLFSMPLIRWYHQNGQFDRLLSNCFSVWMDSNIKYLYHNKLNINIFITYSNFSKLSSKNLT